MLQPRTLILTIDLHRHFRKFSLAVKAADSHNSLPWQDIVDSIQLGSAFAAKVEGSARSLMRLSELLWLSGDNSDVWKRDENGAGEAAPSHSFAVVAVAKRLLDSMLTTIHILEWSFFKTLTFGKSAPSGNLNSY
jgi:hypothetical protein